MDFTLNTYKQLLISLKEAGYEFQAFRDFLENPLVRCIILRHDVDAKRKNSLRFAKIQAGLEIKGSYYFRIVPRSFDKEVIREIATRGHEIGYHYETMDTSKGNLENAYEEFICNLQKFRKIIPVKTICMHGSPLSKYDNRSLWEKYDYKELGIIGEPYFDINFNKVLYLTDTGRRWDGKNVSIRDKVDERGENQKSKIKNQKSIQHPTPNIQNQVYRTTKDIINAANAGKLPDQIMLTFHPQRWTDKPLPWLKELIWQNIKNQIKKVIIRKNG